MLQDYCLSGKAYALENSKTFKLAAILSGCWHLLTDRRKAKSF
jgi:hypothetical protein